MPFEVWTRTERTLLPPELGIGHPSPGAGSKPELRLLPVGIDMDFIVGSDLRSRGVQAMSSSAFGASPNRSAAASSEARAQRSASARMCR
jgi:hypothetical protein